MAKKGQTFEQIFPDAAGRRAIDQTIDKLDLDKTTLRDAIWICDEAYFQRTGTSPYRKKKP